MVTLDGLTFTGLKTSFRPAASQSFGWQLVQFVVSPTVGVDFVVFFVGSFSCSIDSIVNKTIACFVG